MSQLQIDISTFAAQAFWQAEGGLEVQNQITNKLQDEYNELHHELLKSNMVKTRSKESDEADRQKIASECADVMFMLCQLATLYQFDLEEETRKKLQVNKARRWTRQPNGTYQHVEEDL